MESEYEKQRQLNIERNKQILRDLGLEGPSVVNTITAAFPKVKKTRQPVAKKIAAAAAENETYQPAVVKITTDDTTRRRSLRLSGANPTFDQLPDSFADSKISKQKPSPRAPPKSTLTKKSSYIGKRWKGGNIFGEIPGIKVGDVRIMRMQWSHLGVHRPPVAGIHGSEVDGCFSLALSGGYEDDVDYGEAFTYTGEGGRDLSGTETNPKNLRTAPQSKDQTLTRGNLSLSKSFETKNPIRVLRGYKLKSPYAPKRGYRYDGLYVVEKWWSEIGLAGFLVYKFALKRCPGQPPLVVREDNGEEDFEDDDDEANESEDAYE